MADFLVFMDGGVARAHPVAARLPHPRPALHHGQNVFSRQLASFADFGGGLCFFAAVVRLLIAVCAFPAVFWLTSALLHGIYLALFGLSAMHNASTAFSMALSAVLLGCLVQFAALLYFFAPAKNA